MAKYCGDKMGKENDVLFEKYKKYELEEHLNQIISDLKKENKNLKKEVKFYKKQNKHFKSSKPYKLWKLYAKDEDTPKVQSPIKNIKDIKVALISDQFTYDSFKYEFKVISINPNNWKKQFKKKKPDIFFCESAWDGHNYKKKLGPWHGKIYRHLRKEKENRTILLEILEYCKENSIPTVFWNKEDPPHYRDEYVSFAETAKEFDYIFTSAKECIPWYKRDFNHPHVNLLLFAGQPKLFNPLNLTNEHIDDIVFAGTYYQGFPERTQMMDDIFDRLIENNINLIIFDRFYYQTLNDYPERYLKFTRPPIDYNEVPDLYKKMKWGLNFNTVSESETMFARRIFELALSNVNILSNYSVAADKIFGDNIFIFDRNDDLPDFDNDYEEKRLNNLYNVLENHTCTNRWKQILDTMGFEYIDDDNEVSIIFKLTNLDELDGIVNKFNSISYPNKKLKILLENSVESDISELNSNPDVDSIFSSTEEIYKNMDTEYWIVTDGEISNDFIKKAILHYQYLNKRIAICSGSSKFSLGIENDIENKIFNKINKDYLKDKKPDIEVYYI